VIARAPLPGPAGEVEQLFEPAFRVEVVEAPTRNRHMGTWLLERRTDRDG
jgi:hypothetical protein